MISFIIPLYNRPDEIDELLSSLSRQSVPHHGGWEVVVVEDGSSVPATDVIALWQKSLDITYLVQQNMGPAGARNHGASVAKGETFVFLDSDTILPPQYVANLLEEMKQNGADLFGGQDRAMKSFTPLQKAIDFSMTSFLTTGGIRGSKSVKLDKFYPRTFNMGVSRKAFEAVNGFGNLRFGEDIDFSIRILRAGYRSAFYPLIWLYHKRRSTYKQFYKQVYNSGIARINLSILHPGTLKVVHLFPSLFVLGHWVMLLLVIITGSPWWLLPIPLYMIALLIAAWYRTGSPAIGLRAILTSYIQLCGYGNGFLNALWQRIIRRKGIFTKYEKNFYE
ncbi:MAG: glycosyltransferase [Porphyromonas sp.]|nr:glycosyltransferase [Porphyromonas sp.]